MEAGSHVWCSADPKSNEAWILAEVLKKKDDELELAQVDKKENVFTRPLEITDGDVRKFKGVEPANTPLSDQDRAEGRDNDLITLPHLHEPALLHAVSERFFNGKIYTWTGPVLIAVNPFQRLLRLLNARCGCATPIDNLIAALGHLDEDIVSARFLSESD